MKPAYLENEPTLRLYMDNVEMFGDVKNTESMVLERDKVLQTLTLLCELHEIYTSSSQSLSMNINI